MSKRHGFTLIELLVVISVIAVLMAILLPSLNRAREQGKRVVCRSNLKQLGIAWYTYAQDNDGKLVNGAAGEDRTGEKAWVGNCTASNWRSGGQMPEEDQVIAIRSGALWQYA